MATTVLVSTTAAPPPTTAAPPRTTAVSIVPDATALAKDDVGDKVKVTFFLHPSTPLTAESPAVQAGVGSSCYVAFPDRAVVVKITGTISVVSSLPTSVGVQIPFAAFQYSQGVSCDPQDLINYDKLSPGQSASFTAWIVVKDAISPNNPSGTIPSMNIQPGVRLGCCLLGPGDLQLSGPRVVGCTAVAGDTGPKTYYVVFSPAALPSKISIDTCVPAPGS